MLSPNGAPASAAEGTLRIATWNTGWLLDDTSEERYRNIRKVIERLHPDVLAVQEVESRGALSRALPSGYEIAMADDPKEDQELAVAIKEPVEFDGEAKILFASRRYDYAFPSRRNVLEVPIRLSGERIYIYVVHYKSRGGGRLESDPARAEASRLLLDYFRKNNRKRFLLMGDFNDTPSDYSLNILETGDALSGDVDRGGKYLGNLLQPFYESDFVTQGYFRNYRGGGAQPIVRGARAENDRLRGKRYQFPRDVKVTEALFDQILVSDDLVRFVEATGIFAGPESLEGISSRITRTSEGVAIIQKHGTLPSDHLPVYTDINRVGFERPSAFPKRN
jgi:endonuclease/exonuclease/phosphatase family metal-dependent hydrolase